MEPNNLFIVSCPKAGSTMLQGMLDSHPQLLVLPVECNYFDTIIEDKDKVDCVLNRSKLSRLKKTGHRVHKLEEIRDFTALDWEIFEEHIISNGYFCDDVKFHWLLFRAYQKAFKYSTGKEKYFVDKTPHYLAIIDSIQEKLPAAKFLHIIRDPVDNYWALKNIRLKGNNFSQRILDLQLKKIHLSQKMARIHKDDPNWKTVRYEEVVDNPESQMREVSSWLGVDYSSSMLNVTLCGKKWAGNSSELVRFSGVSNKRVGFGEKNVSVEEIDKIMGRNGGRTSNLAVIPARGGSTRLKNKNIYPLGGKPLIQWTVDAAVASGMFDEIIVSSDSKAILDTVSEDLVTHHHRSPGLATKEVPVLELIISLAKKYKDKFDTITYLLPTCPFRTAEHIKQAFELHTDSVISVVEYQEPIQLAGTVDKEDFTPYFDNLAAGKTNSLFMDKYYRPNGGLYLTNIDTLLEEKSFFKGTIGTVLMSREDSHDINNLFDMKVAEMILSERLL
jgi:CMP-N,N'-diacetyllegionaminic acid synthase